LTTESFPTRTGKQDKSLVLRAAFGGDLPVYDELNRGDRRGKDGKKLQMYVLGAVDEPGPIAAGAAAGAGGAAAKSDGRSCSSPMIATLPPFDLTIFFYDGRSKWIPTTDCTTKLYERLKKHMNGMHIARNAFWGLNHGVCARDILRKDYMHAFDHGVSEQMMTSTVEELHRLEKSLGIQKNRIVKRFISSLQCSRFQVGQGSSLHTTLLRFKRSVLDYVGNLAGVANASSCNKHAVCDATDMQKLTLLVPFLLDGLAVHKDFTRKKIRDQKHNIIDETVIPNPVPGMISCWNDYLRWYHVYRQRENSEIAIDDLEGLGKDLLENLKRTFPHFTDTNKSVWCTEKIHSILHAKENIVRSGRSRNFGTQVTEMKHKLIKVKAKNTNNQHTFALSLLLSEMRADAVKALAMHLKVSPGKRGEELPELAGTGRNWPELAGTGRNWLELCFWT
jgi:hypothetical protein